MIKHIRIQNYRSLVDVSVDLEPLTVLIGRSGTGKTNFVSAIRTLRDLLLNRLHPGHMLGVGGFRAMGPTVRPLTRPAADLSYSIILDIRGLKEPLRYDLGYREMAVHHERLTAGNRVVFAQHSGSWTKPPAVEPVPQEGQVVLGALSGIREAMIAHVALTSGVGCYDFPGSVIHTTGLNEMYPGNPVSGYADNGSNFLATATGIVQNLHQLNDWAAVADSLKAVNSSVTNVSLHEPERDRLDVAHEVAGKLLTLDAAQESEGFRRFLAHMLALYQTPPKQTVIFEHPEHAIHPGAMTALFEEFQSYVQNGRGQVILTTHSPQLLDHFAADQIRVVDIENQETRIGRLAQEQVQSVRDKLLLPGELLTVDPARLPGQLAEVPG